MTVPMELVADVRRMSAEPTPAVYNDNLIKRLIEKRPITDKDGRTSDSTNWTPTYDLNAVVADIWDEKASAVADETDFTADGGSFNRSQRYEMYRKQASRYRAMSVANTAKVKTESHPLSGIAALCWADLPYKDEIENYEQGLV